MTRKKILLLLIAAFAIWSGMQSCKSKKHILSTSPISNKVSEELFADVINTQLDFNTFSSRININLSAGKKSISSKANIKILKDKAIQISVQPLFGVEMLRFYVDHNDVVILDRMNKRYVRESFASLYEIYPVGFDYTTLESLLTNRLFVSGSNSVTYSDFENFSTNLISDQFYLIKSVDKKSGIEYSFSINGNDNVSSTQLKETKRKYELDWNYDEFVQNNEEVFPHKMKVELATPKRKANVGLEFSGIIIDEDFELQLSIPNGYERALISDIINILTIN